MNALPFDAEGFDYPESMLSRKFGREVVNYFAGSPLNRVSFLRASHPFLRAALPSARILLLRELAPLSSSANNLAWVDYPSVSALIGTPFDLEEAKLIENFDSRTETPTLVFLGLDEKVSDAFQFARDGVTYTGQPYFALDVTPRPQYSSIAEAVAEAATTSDGTHFRQARLDLDLIPSDAAILAHARSLLDWNSRNQFCAACGARTLSVHAGAKRTCPPFDRALQTSPDGPSLERPACIARKGVQNISFPRTGTVPSPPLNPTCTADKEGLPDPTVIMAILSPTHTHILLGRQRRWPADFYSTLAGFCEPAESLDEAVRRETWEESGVRVGRVVIHSTQPWPYPANLMIGAIGEALVGGDEIVLHHDPELVDARWFPLEEVRLALKKATIGIYETVPVDHKEGDLRLPPATAIAHQLVLAVVNGFHLPILASDSVAKI
ncbi:NADH pyrophosphatase [Maublancomyces gigas]|uniref:NAD(+) diphosphatase n=1 Tax=Discina gigas TaxID=1032678 RepID=A0ABR3GUI2_9PEZI